MTRKMVYEIINPSDPYTMVSDDPAAACAACMVLSQGAYGLDDEEGNDCAPILLFGGDADESMKAMHGVTLFETLETRLPAVRDAMASVLIGGFGARAECEAALRLIPKDKRRGFLEKRHEARRSSMNDIGKRAAQYTELLSAKLEKRDETQETTTEVVRPD